MPPEHSSRGSGPGCHLRTPESHTCFQTEARILRVKRCDNTCSSAAFRALAVAFLLISFGLGVLVGRYGIPASSG